MADEQRQEPTERTPKGYETRIPERREFFGNLKKAAKPQPPKRPQNAPQNRGKGSRRLPTPRGNAPGK